MPILQEQISSRHFAELVAAEYEPPRWVRMICQQLAMVVCILANTNRKPNTSPYRVEQFLPWQAPRMEQSDEEMRRICEAMAMQTFGEGDVAG